MTDEPKTISIRLLDGSYFLRIGTIAHQLTAAQIHDLFKKLLDVIQGDPANKNIKH